MGNRDIYRTTQRKKEPLAGRRVPKNPGQRCLTYRTVGKTDGANLWGRPEPELQQPDRLTSLLQVRRLLSLQDSVVKAVARSLTPARNLV